MEEYYRVTYRRFGSTEVFTITIPACDFFTTLNKWIEGVRISSSKLEILNIYDSRTDQPIIPGGLDNG